MSLWANSASLQFTPSEIEPANALTGIGNSSCVAPNLTDSTPVLEELLILLERGEWNGGSFCHTALSLSVERAILSQLVKLRRPAPDLFHDIPLAAVARFGRQAIELFTSEDMNLWDTTIVEKVLGCDTNCCGLTRILDRDSRDYGSNLAAFGIAAEPNLTLWNAISPILPPLYDISLISQGDNLFETQSVYLGDFGKQIWRRSVGKEKIKGEG